MAARKKKTRAKPSLTAERVRDEALRLIESEGLEGFSTRKLGRALGVEAMAIYWYYPSKDALLDAVVEALVAKLGAAPASGKGGGEPGDFIDALRKLAHAYRALAQAYPNTFPLLTNRRFGTEASFQFLDNLFTLGERLGLDGRMTARFYRLILSYCSGSSLEEIAGNREAESDHDTSELRSSFPRVAKVFEWLGPNHYEDVFSFGLELLLGALREQSTRSGRSDARAPKKTAAKRKAKA
jgi:AcrR family transcriptional regulator